MKKSNRKIVRFLVCVLITGLIGSPAAAAERNQFFRDEAGAAVRLAEKTEGQSFFDNPEISDPVFTDATEAVSDSVSASAQDDPELFSDPVFSGAPEEVSEAGAGAAQEGLDSSENQTTEADRLAEDTFFIPDSDVQQVNTDQVNTDNEVSRNESEAAQDIIEPEAGQAGFEGAQDIIEPEAGQEGFEAAQDNIEPDSGQKGFEAAQDNIEPDSGQAGFEAAQDIIAPGTVQDVSAPDSGQAEFETAQDVSEPDSGQAESETAQEQYFETDSESVSGQDIAEPENTQEITSGPEEQATDAEDSLQGAEQAVEAGQEDPDPASEVSQEIPESEVLIECGGEEIVTATPVMMGVVTADETVPSFTTLDDTLQYVREKAEARQESIIVQIPPEVFDQLDLVHYSDIFAHTGDPRGGDYLMYSVARFGSTHNPPDEMDETRLLEYHFQYRTTASQEEEADRETMRLVSSLGLNDDSKSVYDKIKAIHDYICGNVEYDYDTYNGVRDDYPETYAGYGALVNHLAVCQGYSSMFYRLCLEAGIDARVITSNSLGHAWNIVEIDNIYYLIDCTWDENGDTDNYFLRGVKDFFGHKNSDDNFQDAGFASQYPLSEFKYGFEIKILGKAPDFTLITADRRTISTAAQNGRAKALIFFKEDCPNAQLTLNSLRGKEFDGIDFVYVYMCSRSADQQTALSRIGSEFPTDLPGTYAVCANGYDALYTIEGITGIRDPEGWTYSTTVFFIDPENNIILAEQGFGGDLSDLLESILEDPNLPPAPGQGADEYAGFTAIGNCGQNAVWRLYEDGTLRISGSGQLYDNGSPYSSIGWLSDEKTVEKSYSCENIQAADIKKVIVDEGITYIGWEMFSDCSNLQSIDFYGHAPEFYWYQPLDHDIKVYFPENDDSWNNVDKSIFSEGTKWISRDASGTHHHKWSSWKTTKAATIQAEGSKERSCTECGKKETAVIARLPKISVSTLSVTFSSSIVYTGKALTPAPTVKSGSTVLKAGTDYNVSSYKNNINAGTATATLTGKGDYTGTRSLSFTIKRKDVSASSITVTGITEKTYTGKALTQSPVVKGGTTTLVSGTQYTVSYKNNTNAGTATLTITGKGNYTGTRSTTFKIKKAAQSISAKSSAASVAVGKTATVTITGNKGTKSYKSSKTAVATVSSTGVVTAKKVGTVTITATSASTANYNAASKTLTIKVVPAATTSLTASNLATGIKLTWKAVTGANGYKIYRNSTLVKTITSGSTVTFTDTKANTNGTKYTYKVVAKASTGDSTLSKSRIIYRLARPAISSATNSAASKMTVKWGKNANATGYEIQYSTSKTFASGNKTVTAAGASTVSKVIASLTKGKTYYVRIRSCKTVNNVKYISAWSATKSLKIIK